MRKVKPLISIIIPNYNHEKYLAQRLESVFNQTYTDFEVILLDDCSTDNSRAILLEYAKNLKVSHCVFNEINSGNTFVQWNKGIALAKGEYIWVAESDDYCELNFLEELIQPLIEDKDVVLSYCQSNSVNENGVVTGNWLDHTDDLDSELFTTDFCMDGNEFVEKFLVYKNIIPNASAVVFRKDKIGEIDDDVEMKTCGDWLIYFKVILNFKVAFRHEPLNNFRFHLNSVIANAVSLNNRILFLDITYSMRQKMKKSIILSKPLNKKEVKSINNELMSLLIYKKVFHLIRNRQKVKGYLLLFLIISYFTRNYDFKKYVSNLLDHKNLNKLTINNK